MSRTERRTLKSPHAPARMAPRLSAEQRRDIAIVALQSVRDIDLGLATEETLWNLVRDALTLSHAAELLGAGQREMREHLEHITTMVRHYGAAGRVEFTSARQAAAVRLGLAYMEDLAGLVTREMAIAAALFSERLVEELKSTEVSA